MPGVTRRVCAVMLAAMCMLVGCQQESRSAPEESQPTGYSFEHGYPVFDAAQRAYADSDYGRAVQAYHFWYPTVSAEGIFQGNRDNGIEDDVGGGISAVGPRQVGFTLNSDTPYASAVLDVSQGPMVVEVPAGPYIGVVNDHNQRWVADLGVAGPNAGKGDKVVIVAPEYAGKTPKGYAVGKSDTYKLLLAVRAIPVNGDQKGAIEALKQIKVYPLNAKDKVLVWTETTDRKMDASCLRWEANMQFWQVLKKVVDEEPVLMKTPGMSGLMASIGIVKGQPFNPDSRMSGILLRAAMAARDQMLVSAFATRRPERRAWAGGRWQWVGLLPNTTQFETPMGLDLEARDRWFIQATGTSPAMFRRTAGAGSLYWMAARDNAGVYLDGGKNYKLTIPLPVPAKLFWSVTAYDAQTRSEVQTDQDKAALRSMFELKDVLKSEHADLYFGPTAPAGHEGQWIKTVPGRGWFAYMRIYGPEQAAFDGSWKPGDFEVVK